VLLEIVLMVSYSRKWKLLHLLRDSGEGNICKLRDRGRFPLRVLRVRIVLTVNNYNRLSLNHFYTAIKSSTA
jgi:hypothetical protein